MGISKKNPPVVHLKVYMKLTPVYFMHWSIPNVI